VHNPELNVGLKVGLAKIEGKKLYLNLTSDKPLQIKGKN